MIARLGELLISYVYANKIGIIHISWLLISCIFPKTFVFWLSIGLMFPLLIMNFVFMYIVNIPDLLSEDSVNNIIYQELFFKFKAPFFELAFLYLMVLLFSLMIKARS